ncbi:helix-turn-helix transcriptional regulator [Selenomonas sputigena]|uniref:helix-turn-helix transcriptional regulator n=1 Tax=Selenomonas sputigena TaxID=69823 RepID=UPI00222E0F3A|nr:WYL domain-containing protein [Selenomonas sputigena]UZD43526.1 WYL domain-containing protein [Selenomonas sputigena]
MYLYELRDKKALNMMILEVLEQYTDSDHRLTQQKIVDLLEKNYGVPCTRQTVKNNLMLLKNMGYDISMWDGIFLKSRLFDNAELRMLIDSVLFSRTLSGEEAERLIKKLTAFGNKYFHAKVKHVCHLPKLIHSDNTDVLRNLDVLNDAIEQGKKVRFTYNSYGKDFQLHPRRKEPYIVNPYQMVANQDRYYLLGNYDKYNNISHYRLDCMTNVQMLDDKVKPKDQVEDFAKGYSLPRHMVEHIYMFSGPSVQVKMRVSEHMMGALIDWFGKEFRIVQEDADKLIVSVACNKLAMRYWALQYGEYAEILEPESLRDEIREAVNYMASFYR